jgi:hypothetical protein
LWITVCTRKTNTILTKQTGWTYEKGGLRATHALKCHSEIPNKDVMPLLPPEYRVPIVVKRVDRKEGEMPEATYITKGIEGTLQELHMTKKNVKIKGRCDISRHKDVFEKYEEPGDSLGVMGACLQPQAIGGSTNLPEHDIRRDQLLSNSEENWCQAT